MNDIKIVNLNLGSSRKPIVEHFTSLDDEGKRTRFLMHKCSSQSISNLVHSFDSSHDNLFGVLDKNHKIIAISQLSLMSKEKKEYEFSISVSEPYRKKGLGSKLVTETFNIAKKMKVGSLYSECLRTNSPMLKLLKSNRVNIASEFDQSSGTIKFQKEELSLPLADMGGPSAIIALYLNNQRRLFELMNNY